MAASLVILFEVNLGPAELFGGDCLETTLLVLLLETLAFGLLALGIGRLLTALWEVDVCLSTSLAARVFPFFVFMVDFCVALATEDLCPVFCEDDVCLRVDLVTCACFCLGLAIAFLFIPDDCSDLDLSPEVSWCAELWTKFCFFEVVFDRGGFCAMLARNCVLVEVDFFAASWEGNELLAVDLEVEDFLNLDATVGFGNTDRDDFGRIPVSEA